MALHTAETKGGGGGASRRLSSSARATWGAGLLALSGLLAGTGLSQVAGHLPKIVGGIPSPRDRWPWLAAIVSAGEPSLVDAQFCGGVLIHPRWVVTAAHCMEGETPSSIRVVLGVHDLETDAGQVVQVSEIIRHPAYDDFTIDSDIALLRLSAPVTNRETLALIDDTALAAPGVLATVIGWGAVDRLGLHGATVVREAQIPIVSLAVANAPSIYDGTLTANMLPAGYAQGGKDACSGDSGGPLIVPASGGLGWRLGGIVSFGRDDLGCGDPGNYGVYTRCSAFRSWILSKTLPTYAQWESSHDVTGEWLDPDRDGGINWLEFLRGTDPLNGRNDFVEIPGVLLQGGKRFGTFTFRRRTGSDIGTEVFYSPDGLTNWQIVDQAADLIGTAQNVPGEAGLQQLTVKAPIALGSASAGFFRLRVTPTP